jgi:hypothetical protein
MRLIIAILALSLFSFDKKVTIDIHAGQEVDGLILGKNTIQDAINKYGKHEEFSQGISCGKVSYHTNRFHFLKSEFVIISRTEERSEQDKNLPTSEIIEIGVLNPSDAKTEKGVKLMTDDYDDIIKFYGDPEKRQVYKSETNLHYYSLGISFACSNQDKSIQKVAIYKKGKEPDFYYWRR